MKVFVLGLCLVVLTTQGPHTFNVPISNIGTKEKFSFSLETSEDVTFSFAIPATPTISPTSVIFVLKVFNAGTTTEAYTKSISVSAGASVQDSGWVSAPIGSYEMTLAPSFSIAAVAMIQFDVETSSGVFLLQNMLDVFGVLKYRVIYAKNSNTEIVCQSPDATAGSSFDLRQLVS